MDIAKTVKTLWGMSLAGAGTYMTASQGTQALENITTDNLVSGSNAALSAALGVWLVSRGGEYLYENLNLQNSSPQQEERYKTKYMPLADIMGNIALVPTGIFAAYHSFMADKTFSGGCAGFIAVSCGLVVAAGAKTLYNASKVPEENELENL